jgi:hypothetical protein
MLSLKVTEGHTRESRKDRAALVEFAKLKSKLEEKSCWLGNGYQSICKAFADGKINQEQFDRYRQINKNSNNARHGTSVSDTKVLSY